MNIGPKIQHGSSPNSSPSGLEPSRTGYGEVFTALICPGLDPADTTVRWLQQQITAYGAGLILFAEYLERDAIKRPFPFPHELLARLSADQVCLDPIYIPRINTIVAGLPGMLAEVIAPTSHVRVDVLHSNPDTPNSIVLPHEVAMRDRFNIRRYVDAKTWRAARSGKPDIVLVENHHSDRRTLELTAGRSDAAPISTIHWASKEFLAHFVTAKQNIELCWRHLAPLGVSTRAYQSLSIPESVNCLVEKCLEYAQRAPYLVRSIMFRFDQVILPELRQCGYPIAWTFRSSDQFLVNPLLSYHADVRKLHRLTKSLELSPLASLAYFAADALHLRYFASYDQEDVGKIPRLLKNIFPEVERLIAHCKDGASRAEPHAAERHSLRMYLRGLMNGIVTLADFGAFEDHIDPTAIRSPRANPVLEGDSLGLHGGDFESFRKELKVQGSRLITLLKEGYRICPEEFGPSIPAWFEFFHGYYGSDEVHAINRFNLRLPPDERITLLDVLTGSDLPRVHEYYLEHRGMRPRGREERKRSQFSADARRHVLHGREVWRLVNAAVTCTVAEVTNLTALKPSRVLASAAVQFSAAAKWYPGHYQLFTRISEYISRLAPPLDSPRDLLAYMQEGELLFKNLNAFLGAAGTAGGARHSRDRNLAQASRALYSHLSRIAAVGGFELTPMLADGTG